MAMTTAVERNRCADERQAALAFPWPLPGGERHSSP
jgi:hypothetical protein